MTHSIDRSLTVLAILTATTLVAGGVNGALEIEPAAVAVAA
jgi:outer membrane murein-binding lipoprotein Lpp